MSSFSKQNDFLDKALRPQSWDEYIGQENIKNNLNILIKAAKQRGSQIEHLLFYGPPGLGKTSISYLIAKEFGSNIKVTSGPAIEKVGDLASILNNLQDGDILFIDEIHRLNKNIEEVLYPAMESGVLDIIIGKGASARVVQIELPEFTLVAATTQISKISSPLRSRFSGGVFRLEYYNIDELETILENSAKKLGIEVKDKEVLKEIAKRSRKTPRIANYLLKRVRDYSEVHGVDFTLKAAKETFANLMIDEYGLDSNDKKYLETLLYKFSGGPVGLKTLAAALSEEESTLEEYIEPYLLQEAFIERTSRGRIITKKGRELF